MGDLQRHIALKKHTDRAAELTRQLVNLGNVMGSEYEKAMVKGMVQALQNEHRTLQQGFVEMLRDMLVEYSKTPTDLRNESAVAFAKKVTEIEHYFPRI